jgi:hypothetical protein
MTGATGGGGGGETERIASLLHVKRLFPVSVTLALTRFPLSCIVTALNEKLLPCEEVIRLLTYHRIVFGPDEVAVTLNEAVSPVSNVLLCGCFVITGATGGGGGGEAGQSSSKIMYLSSVQVLSSYYRFAPHGTPSTASTLTRLFPCAS